MVNLTALKAGANINVIFILIKTIIKKCIVFLKLVKKKK
jgi:hypothetical protein